MFTKAVFIDGKYKSAVKVVIASAFLFGTVVMSGCNTRDAENLSRDTAHLAQDTTVAFGSLTLEGKVKGVLALRKGVDMSGLTITAKDGVVTLGGHVRNREERKRVVDTVNGIRGVDRVVNSLELSK